MKRFACIIVVVITCSFNVVSAAPPVAVAAQQPSTATSRDAMRDKLRTLLTTAGARKDVNVEFRQSEKQPYNFVGVMRDSLTNCDLLEIVVSVTTNDTISFRIYPHYNKAYINVEKAKDGAGLMRKLLNMSDHNFLYWGADDTGDVFCGYTFTLESGFPEEAIIIVLRSIRNTDSFVGEMRPAIDGAPAPAK